MIQTLMTLEISLIIFKNFFIMFHYRRLYILALIRTVNLPT